LNINFNELVSDKQDFSPTNVLLKKKCYIWHQITTYDQNTQRLMIQQQCRINVGILFYLLMFGKLFCMTEWQAGNQNKIKQNTKAYFSIEKKVKS